MLGSCYCGAGGGRDGGGWRSVLRSIQGRARSGRVKNAPKTVMRDLRVLKDRGPSHQNAMLLHDEDDTLEVDVVNVLATKLPRFDQTQN